MPSDHDRELDRQLSAFGATLEQRTHEPIGPAADRALAQDPSPNRRVWVPLAAAACVVALVAGLVLLGGGDEPSRGAASPGLQATTVPAPPDTLHRIDEGGEPAFDPLLLGIGAVVEATVVGHLGPIAELNEFGAVDYPGRPDDAAEWTTPTGLPVLVLDDLAIVEVIGGSASSDAAAQRLQDAVAAGEGIEVLAPVGVFAQGERYQLWISDRNQPADTVTYLTYLAFDAAGEPVPGLGLTGLDAAIDVLVFHTGDTVVASLAALAREFNVAYNGGSQGPLMDAVFGPRVPVSLPGVSTSAPPAPPPPTMPPTMPPTAPDLSAAIGDDPLGLLADGWTRSSRDDEPFVAEYDGCADPSSAAIAGTESVREFLSDPVSGTTVVVTYLPVSAGADLRASTSALSGCAALVGSDLVTSLDEPGAGVSGFRTDTFALVAVSADGVAKVDSRPVALALSVLPAADAAVVADLVQRARQYVFSTDAIASDEPIAID